MMKVHLLITVTGFFGPAILTRGCLLGHLPSALAGFAVFAFWVILTALREGRLANAVEDLDRYRKDLDWWRHQCHEEKKTRVHLQGVVFDLREDLRRQPYRRST